MTAAIDSLTGVLAALVFAGAGTAAVAVIADACLALAGRSPVVTIDDPDRDGSGPGTWATAIAHTPALAAQCVDGEPFGAIDVND